jgi:hypothetical protein
MYMEQVTDVGQSEMSYRLSIGWGQWEYVWTRFSNRIWQVNGTNVGRLVIVNFACYLAALHPNSCLYPFHTRDKQTVVQHRIKCLLMSCNRISKFWRLSCKHVLNVTDTSSHIYKHVFLRTDMFRDDLNSSGRFLVFIIVVHVYFGD